MSSPYPFLNDRPIDQWKVTELKQELKNRKLLTKGLKEDLIRRLVEALQNENSEVDVDNVIEKTQPESDVPVMDVENVNAVSETANGVVDEGNKKYETLVDDMDKMNNGDNPIAPGVENAQPGDTLASSESFRTKMVLNLEETTVETITVEDTTVQTVSFIVSEGVLDEGASRVDVILDSDSKKQDRTLNAQLETSVGDHQVENPDSRSHMDPMLDSSAPTNQVSEVRHVLGLEVKSDLISTDSVSINENDSMSINENNEPDNVVSDNVKSELEVGKEEKVETSFSNFVQDGGECSMDVDELSEKVSVQEKIETIGKKLDMSKKDDTVDVGYSEMLNLDRSSGDDSMDDDVGETNHTDSIFNTDDVVDKSAQIEVPIVSEKIPVNVVDEGLFVEIKEVYRENTKIAEQKEKRKLPDQEAGHKSEIPKKQRKWNSQTFNVSVPQSSALTLSATPKDTSQSPTMKRKFSRSDSTNIEATTPKERVVPSSPKTATTSLRIDRFVRPFTLKAVQELLAKTGSVTSFWMDQIKTHCYVTYSSVEEAIATRNALYNLQWPTNGGLLLTAEYVDPNEVQIRAESSLQTTVRQTTQPQLPSLQQVPRQHQLAPPLRHPPRLSNPLAVRDRLTLPPPQPTLPPPPFSNPLPVRERLTLPPPPPVKQPTTLPPPPPVREPLTLPPSPPVRQPATLRPPPPVRQPVTLPPPPPLPKNSNPPIVTLDDLFRKTKAMPRIYYLPLSEEQVAAKGKSDKQ